MKQVDRDTTRHSVVGIDGWKSKWVAVALEDGVFVEALVGEQLPDLLRRIPGVQAVGIDIPIGFPTTEPRRADQAARVFVGPRRSSVFPTLPETAYRAETYEEANELCRHLWGKGVSQQAFALRAKVLEAAEFAADSRVFEVHPEVTFAAMAGQPLHWPKRSWNGQQLRRQLLAENGIVLPADLGQAGPVPVDDVLDAAACAWTAHRVWRGIASTLPPDPTPGEPAITY